MSKETISVYTDGGCSGNPGPGGWAFVICRGAAAALQKAETQEGLAEGDIARSGAEKDTTNNRMELTAAIKALAFMEESGMETSGAKIKVYTDSQYVQKGITEWVPLWKRKNWKNSAHEPVRNRDLWEELDRLNIKFSPEWFWVKGHAGNKYNEICDSLTREAVNAL